MGGAASTGVCVVAAGARCTAYQTNTSTRWSSVCSTVQASVPPARGPHVTDVTGRLARQGVYRARRSVSPLGEERLCGIVFLSMLGGALGPDGERWSAYDVVGTEAGANVTFDVSADLATITQNTKR